MVLPVIYTAQLCLTEGHDLLHPPSLTRAGHLPTIHVCCPSVVVIVVTSYRGCSWSYTLLPQVMLWIFQAVRLVFGEVLVLVFIHVDGGELWLNYYQKY